MSSKPFSKPRAVMIFPADVVKEWRINCFVTSSKHCFWRQDVFFYCVTTDHKFSDLKQHSLSHHVHWSEVRIPLHRVLFSGSDKVVINGPAGLGDHLRPRALFHIQMTVDKIRAVKPTERSSRSSGTLTFPSLISAPSYKGSFD